MSKITSSLSEHKNYCAKMNYTNAVLNGTLDLLAGDSTNISTLVSRGDSITTFASAIISDAMYFNSDIDIRKNLAKKLNLTGDEINDFFNKATIEEAKNINRTTTAIGRGASHPNSTGNNDASACEYYCNGLIKDVFTNYKNMHGYISLAVSNKSGTWHCRAVYPQLLKPFFLVCFIFNTQNSHARLIKCVFHIIMS